MSSLDGPGMTSKGKDVMASSTGSRDLPPVGGTSKDAVVTIDAIPPRDLSSGVEPPDGSRVLHSHASSASDAGSDSASDARSTATMETTMSAGTLASGASTAFYTEKVVRHTRNAHPACCLQTPPPATSYHPCEVSLVERLDRMLHWSPPACVGPRAPGPVFCTRRLCRP